MEAAIQVLAILLGYQARLALSWDVPRIANDGEFPFHAALIWQPTPESIQVPSCDGAIIDKSWILSSAYCVTFSLPPNGAHFVKVGNQDLKIDDDRIQVHQIDQMIAHEKYPRNRGPESQLLYYDIGLIKLKTVITFTDFIKPIKLPKANSWLTGSHKLEYNLIMSGWGQFAYHLNPDRPTAMRTIQLPIIPNKVCTESIRNLYPGFKVGDMQMCTRPLDGGIQGCIGDWGAPLIQYDKHNEPEVVGVVVHRHLPCTTNLLPPVYTHVGTFVNWIKKKMKP